MYNLQAGASYHFAANMVKLMLCVIRQLRITLNGQIDALCCYYAVAFNRKNISKSVSTAKKYLRCTVKKTFFVAEKKYIKLHFIVQSNCGGTQNKLQQKVFLQL